MRRALLLFSCAVTAVLATACDPPREPPRETAEKKTAVEAATWPTAPDQEALGLLDADSRAAAARSPVPVLVPKRKELLAVGKVMSDEHWFAFSATHDGMTVSVHATRIEYKYDDIPPAKGKQVVRGVPGFVSRNEGIWNAAWREHGISYAVDLECHEPTDARCATDAPILELTSDLAFVGGKASNGGAR
ncbi:MAG: hypothetical protein HYV09_08085 [Deltaproteobacteria bacterium]|nr:hypothetical protein [Deltaproteobacteria bacterium]